MNQDSDITNILEMDASSHSKRRLKWWLGWGIAILLIAAAVLYWIGNDKNGPVRFKTQTVERGDLTVTVTATGTLEPTNQVDIGSELSGIIETVEADYNDHVAVGQVLVRLDTSKLKAEVMKSEAALASARGKVMEAQATLFETRNELARMKHARELTQNKTPSQSELDAAEASFRRAQAALVSAQAEVTEAQATLTYNQTDLSKAVIRSPVNGIVLSRDVEPGQTVAASLEAPVLFTLAEDLISMELHVGIDEADVSRVTEGQQATFTVDAYPDRTFPAQIMQVRYGSETTDGVVTYTAVLRVNNEDLSLRPGMTATAVITVKSITNAVLVPNAALRYTPVVESAGETEKTSGNGSVMSKLLPRPPQHQKNGSEQLTDMKGTSQQRVWKAVNGAAVPVSVSVGMTDGVRTEITQGEIEPGLELIVGTVSSNK